MLFGWQEMELELIPKSVWFAGNGIGMHVKFRNCPSSLQQSATKHREARDQLAKSPSMPIKT